MEQFTAPVRTITAQTQQGLTSIVKFLLKDLARELEKVVSEKIIPGANNVLASLREPF